MEALAITLIALAVVSFGALALMLFVHDLRETIRELQDWRHKPDLVIALFVILLMSVLTLCAPLREKLFSVNSQNPTTLIADE